jgi:hypothetical protein
MGVRSRSLSARLATVCVPRRHEQRAPALLQQLRLLLNVMQ